MQTCSHSSVLLGSKRTQATVGHEDIMYKFEPQTTKWSCMQICCISWNCLDRHNVDPVTDVVCQAVGLGSKLGLDVVDAVAVVCFSIRF